MPHQELPEEATVKAEQKHRLEMDTKPEPDMLRESSGYQKYLEAKRRFPTLSFDLFCRTGCYFVDSRIQRALPDSGAVEKYLQDYIWSLYECVYEGVQQADRKQTLHEILEKGPVVERALPFVVHYLDNYLLSNSSAGAREIFSATNLYEEVIRPLIERQPELMRSATIRFATTLLEKLSDILEDDQPSRLSIFNAIECPQLCCLVDDPNLSQFLSADQLEAAKKTLEKATKRYNADPELHDYLSAAHETLEMLD
jgi:hypothetical protein